MRHGVGDKGMTWNYRVVRKRWRYPESMRDKLDGEVHDFLAVHEVYYDSEGKPFNCTVEPRPVSGENVGALRWQLEHMLKALDEPVLNYDEIGDGCDESHKKDA